jgi:uncharacterized protein YqcC (DUF446 family)
MQSIREQLSCKLGEMEQEMRRIGHWTGNAPSPEALASQVPFCYDTLQFQEWLQWVFLPKLGALLEQGLPLPAKSDIAPLAEAWFLEQEIEQEAARLLEIIRELDALLSNG